MRAISVGSLTYHQFESLPAEVVHGVFTRHGGVSPAPWGTLNMSISVGDTRERVRENRHRAFAALGRDPASVADVWQVHSARVVFAETPHDPAHAPQADILLTRNPAVTLFQRFADCVPVVLYDPRQRVVGLVHAGWRGTALHACAVAVQAMTERYGSRPAEVLAGIGPAIGPCHYEVGDEVRAAMHHAYGDQAADLFTQISPEQRPHLDLWAANALDLRRAGVQNIEVAAHCTACHPHTFYSHRAERGQTGRFGVVMGLAA